MQPRHPDPGSCEHRHIFLGPDWIDLKLPRPAKWKTGYILPGVYAAVISVDGRGRSAPWQAEKVKQKL